jgi:tetratricopeptide (TPR) repeat protein
VQKQFSKARDHFAKASELAFSNPAAVHMVLETYLAMKDMSVPNRFMKQLEQAEQPNPELIFQVGTLFLRYESYEQATKAFETLVALHSLKPEVYLMLAEAYDKRGKPDDAYRALSRSIELEPKSEDGYLALATFSSAHHNNEFGLKTIGQGLEKIPGSSRLLLQQGVLWALEGDLVKAEDSFQKASQANLQWGLPQLALGVSQLQAGKLAQAADTFQKVAKQDSNNYRAEYLYALALTRAGVQGDVTRRNEVIAALRRATHLNPNDAECRVLLGQTYMAAGQPEPAITELQKAIKLDPQNAAAHYQLGIAFRKQGKVDAAQRELGIFEELKAKLKEEESEERKALIQMLKVVK